jgi:hypothetical protein
MKISGYLAAGIGLLAVSISGYSETFRSSVEAAARQCDVGSLAALKPLSKAEKDIAVVRSWTAFGQAFELGQKALAAIEGKAMWIGPSTAEKGADDALALTKKCKAAFEVLVIGGGDINLAIEAEVTAGEANALQYLINNGANPAARNSARNNATHGMLALRMLAQHDFAGREDKLRTYLNVLVPRMGRLKGLKDGRGLPVVYYALGLDPLLNSSFNQKTVDTIIKSIASAGADVGAPWKQAYIGQEDRAFSLYRGTDPDVLKLLRD